MPWFDPRTTLLIGNTLTLAAIGGLATVSVAMVIAYARRASRGSVTALLGRLAGFGYAVPGAVIAVGLLIPFGAFDRWLNTVMTNAFGISTGLLLTGTIAAVLFAYVVRFLAVSLNGVEAGLARIPPSLDGASRTLGAGPARTFARVHAPLLSGGLLTAFLITFVDIMKELPATLILRPFNFDTLAIRAYRLASDERLAQAAVPSLMIVLVGLVPVVLLSRQIARSQRHGGNIPMGEAELSAALAPPLGDASAAIEAPSSPADASAGDVGAGGGLTRCGVRGMRQVRHGSAKAVVVAHDPWHQIRHDRPCDPPDRDLVALLTGAVAVVCLNLTCRCRSAGHMCSRVFA